MDRDFVCVGSSLQSRLFGQILGQLKIYNLYQPSITSVKS